MIRALIFVGVLGIAAAAQAHELRPSIADIRGIEEDGRAEITLDIVVNLEAILAGIGPEHTDSTTAPEAEAYMTLRALPPDALIARLRSGERDMPALITLTEGDTRISLALERIDVPETGDIALARDSVLHLRAVPDGPVMPQFAWDASLGPIVLRATLSDGSDGYAGFLTDGMASPPITLFAERKGFWGRLGGMIRSE
ncbi:hypothetical protein FHS89_002699 [Rubricella aquisinus]|uniref:Uncharacterized protein n=1 Tax=Rubricella aquisinus TaxID=2028108 RepID=A0A840WNM5_9RHOB|nr:hypothetical protein [Rubricella aquisinus]MBB5516659.1 hypothetical protein [Rubricella aquisinus]